VTDRPARLGKRRDTTESLRRAHPIPPQDMTR
jgi:hypothetical protein